METDTPITFWILVATMTVIVIGVVVGFAIVIRNVNVKIQTNQDMISTAVTQDEANLNKLGLQLDAEINKEIGDANVKINQTLKQTNAHIDKVNDVATSGIAKVQSQLDKLVSGQSAFQSLSVGPAQIVRDQNGNMNFNAGPIFTVTSSNLLLGLKQGTNPYMLSADNNSNLSLSGPGMFVPPSSGLGWQTGAGINQSSTGPLRMYAPASNPAAYIGLGFANATTSSANATNTIYDDTIQIRNKAATNKTANQVTIAGDLVVSGNMQSPYMTVLQEQITALQAATQQAQAKANLAYNSAMTVLQEQRRI